MEFGLTWAKLDEMEYVTEAEYEHNGEKHTIRFMLTEKGYRNLQNIIRKL